MNKKELAKMYAEGLITKFQYSQKLFDIETAPKSKSSKERRLPKSLKPEEFVSLIKVIPEKDKESRIAFLLAYASGLRVSEIVGAKRKDGTLIPPVSSDKIDFERNTIMIYGKYKVERIVPLPKGWKEWMTPLIPIEKSIRTLERNFKKYAKKAGLNQEYVFHSLRHSFATRSVESGIPVSHIQSLMGHANVATTSVYLKARPEDALKSYQDLF